MDRSLRDKPLIMPIQFYLDKYSPQVGKNLGKIILCMSASEFDKIAQ